MCVQLGYLCVSTPDDELFGGGGGEREREIATASVSYKWWMLCHLGAHKSIIPICSTPLTIRCGVRSSSMLVVGMTIFVLSKKRKRRHFHYCSKMEI